MSFYGFGQRVVRTLRPLVGPLDVDGLEHVPERGAFLLVANHQSYLDPVLIQAIVPRRVYAMAKSTQFSNRIIGAFLRKVGSFPVRRFETDPQAVRITLRNLARGQGVGLYIEGERSWDGRLQPPRLGAIRLILKAGVPVIPCGIRGAYDVWPRWDNRIRRGAVHIRFGAPLSFPQLDDRRDRERALPATRAQVMAALTRLSGADMGAGT